MCRDAGCSCCERRETSVRKGPAAEAGGWAESREDRRSASRDPVRKTAVVSQGQQQQPRSARSLSPGSTGGFSLIACDRRSHADSRADVVS